MTMALVYEREARKQLALAYVEAIRHRVSKFDTNIITGEANSGYEFDAIELAIATANTYGFEIPQELHDRARELFVEDGCSTETFDQLLAHRPSLRS